jgi:hypothetical protein
MISSWGETGVPGRVASFVRVMGPAFRAFIEATVHRPPTDRRFVGSKNVYAFGVRGLFATLLFFNDP